MNKYEPVSMCKDNPRYFMFRGRPTILFTSAEHYAIVMNKAFDYIKYLDKLQAFGFNHSRVYTGVKRERVGEHNIDGNTLAPRTEDFICPWKRTDIPGANDGGNKYDLDQFDEEYFERFKTILTEAGKRSIEFEVILHGPLHYGGDGVGPWGVCPLNIENNINGVGGVPWYAVNSLKDKKIVEYQDRYVRKLVTELNEFDNLHYEICNEPNTGTAEKVNGQNARFTDDDQGLRWSWQQHVADVVYETESSLPNRHVIAANIFIGTYALDRLMDHVDHYNFHYTTNLMYERNFKHGKSLGMNETGIMASGLYHRQAWETVLCGGSLYNFLDYSYTIDHEDGTYDILPSSPGYGGGEEMRKKLKVAMDFINAFDFVKMRPAQDLIRYCYGSNMTAYLFAEYGWQYAAYLIINQHSGYAGRASMGVNSSDGRFNVEFIDPITGEVFHTETEEAKDGKLNFYATINEVFPHNREFEVAIRARRID